MSTQRPTLGADDVLGRLLERRPMNAGWNYDHPWWPHSLRRYLPKRYLRWSYMRALRRAMEHSR